MSDVMPIVDSGRLVDKRIVKSATNPDVTYEVRLYDESETATCSCKGFSYRRYCRHTKEALAAVRPLRIQAFLEELEKLSAKHGVWLQAEDLVASCMKSEDVVNYSVVQSEAIEQNVPVHIEYKTAEPEVKVPDIKSLSLDDVMSDLFS